MVSSSRPWWVPAAALIQLAGPQVWWVVADTWPRSYTTHNTHLQLQPRHQCVRVCVLSSVSGLVHVKLFLTVCSDASAFVFSGPMWASAPEQLIQIEHTQLYDWFECGQRNWIPSIHRHRVKSLYVHTRTQKTAVSRWKQVFISQLTRSKGHPECHYITRKCPHPCCSDIIRDQQGKLMFVKQHWWAADAWNSTGQTAAELKHTVSSRLFRFTVSIGENVRGAVALSAETQNPVSNWTRMVIIYRKYGNQLQLCYSLQLKSAPLSAQRYI